MRGDIFKRVRRQQESARKDYPRRDRRAFRRAFDSLRTVRGGNVRDPAGRKLFHCRGQSYHIGNASAHGDKSHGGKSPRRADEPEGRRACAGRGQTAHGIHRGTAFRNAGHNSRRHTFRGQGDERIRAFYVHHGFEHPAHAGRRYERRNDACGTAVLPFRRKFIYRRGVRLRVRAHADSSAAQYCGGSCGESFAKKIPRREKC